MCGIVLLKKMDVRWYMMHVFVYIGIELYWIFDMRFHSLCSFFNTDHILFLNYIIILMDCVEILTGL